MCARARVREQSISWGGARGLLRVQAPVPRQRVVAALPVPGVDAALPEPGRRPGEPPAGLAQLHEEQRQEHHEERQSRFSHSLRLSL